MKRIIGIVLTIAVFGGIAVILLFGGKGERDASAQTDDDAPQDEDAAPPVDALDWTDPDQWPNLPLAELEDPGPGRCFPDVLKARRDMVAAGAFEGFESDGEIDFVSPYSELEIETLQTDIVEVIEAGEVESTRPNCLDDLAWWLAENEDYTLASETIGHEFDPFNRDDLATYFEKLKLVELNDQLAVQNHYFTESDGVQPYRVEKLPEGELVYFVPGYEPGNDKDNLLRPVAKLVCGNPLLPPPPPPPKVDNPPVSTPPDTTTPPASTPPTTTGGGKDAGKSPVDSADEANIPTPSTIIRDPDAPQPDPGPPDTLPEDPPEVSDPEPIDPGIEDDPPVDDDPIEECGDADGDGFPDDSCS